MEPGPSNWPSGGELDILEFASGGSSTTTYHWYPKENAVNWNATGPLQPSLSQACRFCGQAIGVGHVVNQINETLKCPDGRVIDRTSNREIKGPRHTEPDPPEPAIDPMVQSASSPELDKFLIAMLRSVGGTLTVYPADGELQDGERLCMDRYENPDRVVYTLRMLND